MDALYVGTFKDGFLVKGWVYAQVTNSSLHIYEGTFRAGNLVQGSQVEYDKDGATKNYYDLSDSGSDKFAFKYLTQKVTEYS